MKKISKLLDVFEKICVEICVILLAVIALSIFYQVVVRKLGYSVTWVDETTRYAMVLLVFLGTLEIARHGQHIRIVSFVDMLPPGLRKMTEILTYLLTLFPAGIFAYSCFYAANEVGSVRFSMLTFVTMRGFYILMGVIAVLIVLMIAAHIVQIATGMVTFYGHTGENDEMGGKAE